MCTNSLSREFLHNISSSFIPFIFHLDSSTPASTETQQEPDTPRLRRSSRSRTRSPEPVVTKIQDPSLAAVQEEEEETQQQDQSSVDLKDTEMYEKIIDEMDVDQNQAQDEEYDEDELLAESNEQTTSSEQQEKSPEKQEDQNGEQKSENAEQMETSESEKPAQGSETATEEENRGVKRRAESPSKETSPKKRQRLPPPNIDDFVNDEDEPELDENSLQLSWCKKNIFKIFYQIFNEKLSFS